jgi:hypothetical protein
MEDDLESMPTDTNPVTQTERNLLQAKLGIVIPDEKSVPRDVTDQPHPWSAWFLIKNNMHTIAIFMVMFFIGAGPYFDTLLPASIAAAPNMLLIAKSVIFAAMFLVAMMTRII